MVAGAGLVAVAAPLATATPAQASQHLWRWCFQCSGLWFSGNNTNGHCPLGTGLFGWEHPHRSAGSGDYVLTLHDEPGAGQTDWWWCNRCAGLWTVLLGVFVPKCPNPQYLNGVHVNSGSGMYKLETLPNMTNGPGGQAQWFTCRKCAGLFFAGNTPQGVCPAGGAHERASGPGSEHVLRQL